MNDTLLLKAGILAIVAATLNVARPVEERDNAMSGDVSRANAFLQSAARSMGLEWGV